MAAELDNQKPLPVAFMALLGWFTGIVAGVGAAGFRALIALFHNLLFLGVASFQYDASIHTPPSPWGPWVVFVPVVGAMGVAFLVKTFAPEAKGHGVPEVMDAIYHKNGVIRPAVVLVKAFASALSIGSGGSVGREGPIAQIGSAFGSTLGQIIQMPVLQRATLIAAGAGAGIAATFNTPIGGLVFAVELMLPCVTARTLLPVAIATVTATHLGRDYFGIEPAFNIDMLRIAQPHLIAPSTYVIVALFGVILGAASALFVRGIYWFEDRFDEMPGNYYTRHGIGMLGVGALMYWMMGQFGHYEIQGVGYATIGDVLSGRIIAPGLLLWLFAAKFLATGLTLGSGASGGVFSPSLYLGATLGASFALSFNAAAPQIAVDPASFALVGMAGMVAGSTAALLTAVTMLFEMTGDYHVTPMVIIAASAAYATRQAISSESIYTLKLMRRGSVVPEGLQSAINSARRARDVISTDFAVVSAGSSPEQRPAASDSPRPDVVVVIDEGQPVGVMLGMLDSTLAPGQRGDSNFLIIDADESYVNLLQQWHFHKPAAIVVTSDQTTALPSKILGVVTARQIAEVAGRDALLLDG